MQMSLFAIPNRFTHGYGPNKDLFLELYEQGASLIITVDNGISGVDEIAYAKSLGMDVIVTDHHEIGQCTTSSRCHYPSTSSRRGVSIR